MFELQIGYKCAPAVQSRDDCPAYVRCCEEGCKANGQVTHVAYCNMYKKMSTDCRCKSAG